MNILHLLKQEMLKNRRRIVILLVLVFAVLILRAGLDLWMGRQLKSEILQLERKYGPLVWDPVRKLDAWRTWPGRFSPINRARMLSAAAARVTLTDANVNLIFRLNAPLTITSDQARAIADENREALQLALQAARLQHSNWKVVNLSEPANIPNLFDLSNLSSILAIAARSDADAGRADEAVKKIAAGFAEASAMIREPAPIMVMIASSVASIQVEALKDMLCRSNPSGSALAALAAMIDENLSRPPMREAMLGELKRSRRIWPWVERGYFDGGQPGETTNAWKRAVVWLCRPIIRIIARRDLAAKARALEAASMPRSQRAGVSLRHSMGPGSNWPAIGFIEAGDNLTAKMGLAASSVALRRYKLDHGAYPNTLDELVPLYLKTLPLDLFTERPLKYQRQDSGFKLFGKMIFRSVKSENADISTPWEWKISR
jgi:hypothetical protein